MFLVLSVILLVVFSIIRINHVIIRSGSIIMISAIPSVAMSAQDILICDWTVNQTVNYGLKV